MTAQVSYYVDAPVEEVFDYFLDPSKQVALSPPFGSFALEEHQMTDEGVGTFMSWKVKLAGIPMSGLDVVTECERNRHITEKSSNSLVGTWTYDFAIEGTGTRVTMEHQQQSFWALPGLSALTDRATRRMSKVYIGALKARIEADKSAPE